MRFEGTIRNWNDERGFGFIEATQGGEELFVHATAFTGRGRPQAGQRVTFEVASGPRGKKALRVEPVPVARLAQRRARAGARGPGGGAAWLALLVLLVVQGVVAALWRPPAWFLAFYAVASLLTFLVYASDKAAARRGAWRVQESTLHLLALAGGWPGALLAQRVLRHKSAKAQFQGVFWATAVLNVAGFAWLCSPAGRHWWAAA